MNIFMTCVTHLTFSGSQIEKNENERSCGTYGGEEKCIQGFGGETWEKETTCKT